MGDLGQAGETWAAGRVEEGRVAKVAAKRVGVMEVEVVRVAVEVVREVESMAESMAAVRAAAVRAAEAAAMARVGD